MGRKILCPSCNTIFDEKTLKQKNSQNVCLVCGANLSDDEPESTPEEELVTWHYIEFKNSTTYFITEDSKLERDKMSPDMELKYTFQAPPEDENEDCEAAKEVLRREYKPDAFLESNKTEKPAPVVRCPRCGCTNIQIAPRKWSIWTGYRTNAVSRICLNCKHRF